MIPLLHIAHSAVITDMNRSGNYYETPCTKLRQIPIQTDGQILSEVKLSFDPALPSVGWSVDLFVSVGRSVRNKDRKSYRSTCSFHNRWFPICYFFPLSYNKGKMDWMSLWEWRIVYHVGGGGEAVVNWLGGWGGVEGRGGGGAGRESGYGQINRNEYMMAALFAWGGNL